MRRSSAVLGARRDAIDAPLHFRVARAGRFARHALAIEPAWRVFAVFRRSFYCRSARGSLVLVGHETLGAGPLHVLWSGASEPAPRRPEEGMPVGVDLDGTCGDATAPLTLALCDAREWRPPAPPSWRPSSLRRSLAWLGHAADLAPTQGLGRLVAPIASGATDPVRSDLSGPERLAWPAVAALSDWIHAALVRETAATPPSDALVGLIGLGPGLTPSGDDVLAGVLLALHGFVRADVADRLAAWLRPRLAGRTGLVSRAHLECAARGEAAAVLHDALAALSSGDPDALAMATGAVGTLGHSSGWDGLVGIVAVAEAWLAAGVGDGEGRTPCR